MSSDSPTDPRHLERETGIEPASLAWKARVLPLNYSRTEPGQTALFLLAFFVGFFAGFANLLAIFVALVEEAGFEPAYALAGRFTVCCL
jgi:hypothetical protein